MRQMWIFIISMLISIVSIDAVVHANVTVYMNANVGVEYQLEQEGFFLEMLNDPNMPNDPNFFIDFDNSPAGPTSAGPISGNEWQQFGVIFSQPEGFGLELKTADINRTPHSSPHGLWPSIGSERIEMTFNPARTAIGFWLIDSEYNDILNDTVIFYDLEDNVLFSIPLPFTDYTTSGEDGNFFIGVISNIPIARVLMNEIAIDNETVGIDDLYFEGGQHLGCILPPGDINKDCRVDLEDLSIIAAYWLVDCDTDPSDPACAP